MPQDPTPPDQQVIMGSVKFEEPPNTKWNPSEAMMVELINRLSSDPRFIEAVISHPAFRQALINLNVSMEGR